MDIAHKPVHTDQAQGSRPYQTSSKATDRDPESRQHRGHQATSMSCQHDSQRPIRLCNRPLDTSNINHSRMIGRPEIALPSSGPFSRAEHLLPCQVRSTARSQSVAPAATCWLLQVGGFAQRQEKPHHPHPPNLALNHSPSPPSKFHDCIEVEKQSTMKLKQLST